MKDIYKEVEGKMKDGVNFLKKDFSTIRAGRANPAVLDGIKVDYYGVSTPINQIGNISVPEARTLVIQPWDASVIGEVEKAILKSDLGITPNNDGKIIRLNFPPLTEERRKELVKIIHKKNEETKITTRNIRRDSLTYFKDQKKKSEITEDDLKDIEKDIQDLTDKYIIQVDNVTKAKEKEIMEV